MVINESVENYLESILVLGQKKGNVRSIDIVHELNFSKPSVSIAMSRLKENGYVTVNDHGYISLTDKGMEIANATYERHKIINDFLIYLGVPESIASEDACKMEHAVSDETLEKLKEHFNTIKSN